MSFWGAHGIAIVATIWLLGLLVGLDAVMVVATMIPLMVFAVRCYVLELLRRRGRR